jgi:MFS family permease
MVLSVFYIQDLLALSPGHAGLLFPAFNLTVIAGSLIGPRLVAATGSRRCATIGCALLLIGAATLAALPQTGRHLAQLLVAFALMGAGLGLASVASTAVGSASAAPEDSGVASGFLNAAAQIGAAIGLAVLLPLAFGAPGTDLTRHGLRTGMIGVCVVAGLGLLASQLLPRQEEPTQEKEPSPSATRQDLR